MTERGFFVDKKGRTIYREPPPLSAEKRQYLAPLGSNLGQANLPIKRQLKRKFDGKEYNLIGLTRFQSDQSKTDFQHKAAKTLVKRLQQNGWNARVVRWKNQTGVYVRNKNTPKRNFEPTRFGSNARWTELDIQNSAPFMSEYFIGNDKSNRPLYPRRNKRANYLGNRRANLAERPIIFHRKLSEAQKEKEAKEKSVMQYVDEMSDDRSHGNEYLGYAAMRVQGEIEEGKIPKDMVIVKQKIAEYMAEYENETREYSFPKVGGRSR